MGLISGKENDISMSWRRRLGLLTKKYLIAEVAQPEYHLEDQIYFAMLRRSNKSVIEKIRDLESQKQEYKEYIETWIHEVKNAAFRVGADVCESKRAGFQKGAALGGTA